MPRNGSGVYVLPNTYEAVTGETIEAQQHNDPLEDLESDANGARPIVAGGTSATTAIGAHDAFVKAGGTVASASTIDLDAATGPEVDISGTTTITAVTLGSGKTRYARATGAFQMTAGASLIVNGSTTVNYTTVAGDLLKFIGYGSSVVRVWVINRPQPGTGWEPLGLTTLAAAASWSKTDLSAFVALRISGMLFPSADGEILQLQFSNNNGSSYRTGGSDYFHQLGYSNGTGFTALGASVAAIYLSGGVDNGSAAFGGVVFNFHVEMLNSATRATRIRGESYSSITNGATRVTYDFGAEVATAEINDAVRLLYSGGANSTGYVFIEGLRG